jgi:hypothetical protein
VHYASSQIHPLSIGQRLRQWCGAKKDWYQPPLLPFQRNVDFVLNELGPFALATPAQDEDRRVAHGIFDIGFPKVPRLDGIDVQKYGVVDSRAKEPRQRLHQRLIMPAVGHKHFAPLIPGHVKFRLSSSSPVCSVPCAKPPVTSAGALSARAPLTGQAIIRTILQGERDIYVLADLRDPHVKASREEIARSLEGNWREDVLFELKQAVDAYDFVQKQMGECDRELEKYMAALPSRSRPGSDAEETDDGGKKKQKTKKPKGNAPKFDLKTELNRVNGVDLTTIDGIDVMTAETILSEIGTDLNRFKTEQHFVSWAGLTPRQDVSGGKVIRQRSRRVNNRVGNALRLAARSLFRSESYLGAKFRKLRARRGAPKAIKGMVRNLGCLVHRILTLGQAWVDRGTKDFEEKTRQREINDLQRKATALGLHLLPVTANA